MCGGMLCKFFLFFSYLNDRNKGVDERDDGKDAGGSGHDANSGDGNDSGEK